MYLLEWYIFEVFFIDVHLFALAAPPTSTASLSTAGSGAVFCVGSAAEELHVVGDDVDCAPLGAVLGFPGTVLQASFDKYGIALLLVVCNTLAELAPGGDVEEVYFVVLGEHPIDRQSEPAHRRAALREP